MHQFTLGLRVQALMGSQDRVRESVAVDDGGVEGNRGLGHAGQIRV